MSNQAISNPQQNSFVLGEVMSSIADKMQLDFNYLSKQIAHKPSKGIAREQIVRDFLLAYLPTALDIGTGEVLDSLGQRSDQMDLVIFDRQHCPNLVEIGDIRIYPAEGVHAVIQVKSELDKPALKDSIENIRSAKRLVKSAYYHPTRIMDQWTQYGKTYDYFPMMGYLFAYRGNDIESLGKYLDEINLSLQVPPEHQIDTICLLDQGIIAHKNSNGRLISWAEPTNKETNETTVTAVKTKRALLLFYIMIHDQLSIAKMRPIQMLKYIPNDFVFGGNE